jgi:hypothetical protein
MPLRCRLLVLRSVRCVLSAVVWFAVELAARSRTLLGFPVGTEENTHAIDASTIVIYIVSSGSLRSHVRTRSDLPVTRPGRFLIFVSAGLFRSARTRFITRTNRTSSSCRSVITAAGYCFSKECGLICSRVGEPAGAVCHRHWLAARVSSFWLTSA